MEFRVLGPLEVLANGGEVPLGGGKQRALLGALLLHPNEVVSSDRLVDELWGERPPESAVKMVQGYVSGLRRVLGPELVATRPPGYQLDLRDGQLDLITFHDLLEEARSGSPEHAAAQLRNALALWRGPALADLELEGPARYEVEHLNELRLSAQIDRIEADLLLGRHADLVGELEALAAEHPLRERPRGQLMLALYRSGRQAEALEVYASVRATLVEQLGLEPNEELQQLQRRMLAQDPGLTAAPPVAAPPPAAAISLPPSSPAAEASVATRRIVSVVFCDLSDSAALAERLDPESLHQVLSRYYQATAVVLERHGGRLEKFIGDAVVAIFGLPLVREDDALRAVRAALELRDAAAALDDELDRDLGVHLSVHVGVNTGEVFTGPARHGQPLATGEALTVAARLQQAAGEGEILIGADTFRLVADAVAAEPVEPLRLRGRAMPVPAWRVAGLKVEPGAFTEERRAPFVGRSRELTQLHEALRQAVAVRECRLVTVLGPPGIGKSRLGREFFEAVGDEAQVLVGRCPPYGEGITYWPLAEMIRHLAGSEPEAQLRAILGDDDRATLVADRVLGAIGLSESVSPKEETFWAVRKLAESLARQRPLIAVVDDIHWAEETLIELLEHLVAFTRDAPILLVCFGRLDFAEAQPGWVTPRADTTLVALDPLSEGESRTLLGLLPTGRALSKPAAARIVEAAEGNPLFLEQLLALSAEVSSDSSDVPVVPSSIQALLAARIDQLEPEQRSVLQRASIEGRTFHVAALSELVPAEIQGELDRCLLALVRKDLIRTGRPDLEGEDAFRFQHMLIRDAAYASVPKQTRAELHERFADWLEATLGERLAEFEEIVGHHLEQALVNRRELGPLDEREQELAARAAQRLAAAGRRALAGSQAASASSLLRRAAALLTADNPVRGELLADLGGALLVAGEFQLAEAALTEAIDANAWAGNRRIELRATLERAFLRALTNPKGSVEELSRAAEGALSELEALGDEPGLAKAWRLIADVHWIRNQWTDLERALEQSLVHAERAGDERGAAAALMRIPMGIYYGPTPVPEALGRAEAILDRARDAPVVQSTALVCLAALHAMSGEFEDARTLLARGGAISEELGFKVWLAGFSLASSDIEMLADDPAAAERSLLRGYRALERMGERGLLSRVAAELGRAVYAQGRYEEAEALTDVSEELAGTSDVASHISWRAVRAKLLARRSEFPAAESLAREALQVAEETDDLNNQGRVLIDLAEVLELAGKGEEASTARNRALELFERKGNVVSADRTRSLLGGSGA